MKTLGKYEKFEEPILLRKDFARDHQGFAYTGSKMKEPQELFKETAHEVKLKSRFKRPLSSVGRKNEVNSGSLQARPITTNVSKIWR
jgi:hypothetical protein